MPVYQLLNVKKDAADARTLNGIKSIRSALKAHLAESQKETHKGVKNAGAYDYCDKVAYGVWERGKLLGDGVCICRTCWKGLASHRKKQEAGQLSMF